MLHTMYNYIYALTMQHLIYIHIDLSGTYTYITLWQQHCMIHCTRMSEMLTTCIHVVCTCTCMRFRRGQKISNAHTHTLDLVKASVEFKRL